MANPTADYPAAIHASTDVSGYGGTALGGSAVTHTNLEGKQEEELAAVQTKIGTGASTPTTGKVLTGDGTGTSAWSDPAAAASLESATTTVDVAAATAPTTGQVLTATGDSAATWQTPDAGGGGSPFGSTYTIGSAGDYATLNAWNADSPANNDVLFIDGDHSLTSDMTISVSDVTIVGYRSSAITLGAYDITDMGDGAVIDGITFIKDGAGYVRSTSKATVKNVTMEVSATNGNGFLLMGANSSMSNIDITSSTAAIGTSIFLDGDFSTLSDVRVDVVSGKAYNPMVKVSGDYCSVKGVTANSTTNVSNSELIELTGSQNAMSGCTIKSYFSSGLVVSGSNHIISGVTVVQLQPNAYAVEVEGGSNTFTGMSIYAQSTGIRGFWIQQNKTVITGSSFRGFSSGDAIYLDGARDDTLVSGNLIWGWANGVRVTASSQDYTTIVGNKIFDCTTDINDSGTNTFYETSTDSDPLNEIH